MSGNTFGQLFTITTFGESHGKALGCIVDGCPPGLSLCEEDIQIELNRRKPGQSSYTTQRKESDSVEILSGVFEGKTTGTPIGLLIYNEDQKSKDYSRIENIFRPGHGDYTYYKKYGIRDHRGGGRASARETVMRVAAGAIAKKYLKTKCNIHIQGCLSQLGPIKAEQWDWKEVNNNAFFSPDVTKISLMEEYIQSIRKEGNSVGGAVRVEALNIPVGLGEPVFDKLDAELAYGLMSIPAVKGVEIGDGFACITQKGSEHRDEIRQEGFLSNHAGGILAGISTGQPLVANLALKPASSILIPGKTINTDNENVEVVTTGRHDPCVAIRAVPVAEAMMALVIMDHLLRHRAQNIEVKND